MATVIFKKKIDTQTTALSEVKSCARKIWLASLGACAKVGSDGGTTSNSSLSAVNILKVKAKKSPLNNLMPATVRLTK